MFSKDLIKLIYSFKRTTFIIIIIVFILSLSGCICFIKKNNIELISPFYKDLTNLKVVQEVIVSYKHIKLSGIMIVKFSENNIIDSIFLTPSGVKLLEFSIIKNKLKKYNFFGEFKGNKKLAKKIFEIFMMVYTNYKMTSNPFEISYDTSHTLYKIGKRKRFYLLSMDTNNLLITKKLLKNNREAINIEYQDYINKHISFPSTIIYKNFKDKVEITHKLKDITTLE